MTQAVKILSLLVLVSQVAIAGDVIRLKNATLKPVERIKGVEGLDGSSGFKPASGKLFYIVQFQGAIKPEWKTQLTTGGVQLGSYLPDDAFLAKVDKDSAWKALNDAAFVKSVTPYDVKYRISEDFNNISSNQRNTVRGVIVRLTSSQEQATVLAAMKSMGLETQIMSEKLIMVHVASNRVASVAAVEGVEWVEPFKGIDQYDVSTSLADPILNMENTTVPMGDYSDLTGYESGTKVMNFDAAYTRGLNGQGEVVGIADTGLDRGSVTDILDDLKGQLNKAYAYGFFGFNPFGLVKWSDPVGHGTHVAGSVVGTGVTSNGKLRGGAYGAHIVFEHMWNALTNNLSVMPDFDKLYGNVRRDDNVRIHSNSWGSNNFGAYDNFASMVDDISWKYPDLLIVFAAGNSGQDLDRDGRIDEGSVASPGTAKNCLTVGASENLVSVGGIQKTLGELNGGGTKWAAEPIASSKLSDNPNGMAAFSSTGPTKDGRIKPEIAAPGTNIISTRSQQPKAGVLWGAYNQYYAYAGGTSMATPLTSGAAAVTRQGLRRLGLANPSAALVKAALLHTAFDMFPGQYGTGATQEFKVRRPNNFEGFGRVDMAASTNLNRESIIDDTRGLATNQRKNYEMDIKAGQKVRVTMVYTDAPASAGAAVALVNNLDVKVSDYSSETHYPNHLDRPDTVNNSEMVEFVAEHDGIYKVTVSATSVPQGRDGTGAQPYALIMSASNE